MKKEKQEVKNKSKGFTLLELLVVVLIIGILAAIALPQYKMAVAKTKYMILKERSEQIADFALKYFVVHNVWPSNLDDLDIDFGQYINNGKNVKINTDMACDISINGEWFFSYCRYKKGHGFEHIVGMPPSLNFRKDRKCFVWGRRDLNNTYHKMCQQLTGKDEPKKCSGEDYCYYMY